MQWDRPKLKLSRPVNTFRWEIGVTVKTITRAKKARWSKYTDELKAGTVRLVAEGRPAASVLARDFEVDPASGCTWVRRAAADAGREPAGVLAADEEAELTALRKKNRVLNFGGKFSKNAAAFLAQGRVTFAFIEAESAVSTRQAVARADGPDFTSWYAGRGARLAFVKARAPWSGTAIDGRFNDLGFSLAGPWQEMKAIDDHSDRLALVVVRSSMPLQVNTGARLLLEGARNRARTMKRKADLIITQPPCPGLYKETHHHEPGMPWPHESNKQRESGEIASRRSVQAVVNKTGKARWHPAVLDVVPGLHDTLAADGSAVFSVGSGEIPTPTIAADAQTASVAPQAELVVVAVASAPRSNCKGGLDSEEHLVGLRRVQA